VPTPTAASGCWQLGEVTQARRDGIWPFVATLPTTDLIAWYDAGEGVFDATSGGSAVTDGNAVARWEDQSGSGFHLTQATAAAQPTLNNSTLNGLPVLTFASGDAISTALSVVTGATLRTIFAVCRGATANTNVIADLGDGSGAGTQYAITGEIGVRVASGSRIFGTSLSATHALVAVTATTGDVSGTELRVNGSAASVSSTSARTLNTQSGLRVGSSLGGDIAELLIYDAALSTTDRDAVESYLTTKYAL
jgi:hypothetical protein